MRLRITLPGWLRRRKRGTPRPPGRGWLAFLGAYWSFLLGALLVAGGLAAVVFGYLGVSGTLLVGLQIPYVVSGGLLGLALVVVGSALLMVHALSRQSRLLRRLLEETRTGRAAGAASDAPQGDGLVLAVRGGRTFHRPGCELVEGKTARRMRPATAASRGLTPCGVCDPVTAPS